MFGVDFESVFEMYDAVLELYIEDKIVNKQQAQAPKEFLIANFLQTAKQIGQDKRPMKLKMIVPQTIWDNFDNTQKVLNNEVSFSNNAMVAFEESKQTA